MVVCVGKTRDWLIRLVSAEIKGSSPASRFTGEANTQRVGRRNVIQAQDTRSTNSGSFQMNDFDAMLFPFENTTIRWKSFFWAK